MLLALHDPKLLFIAHLCLNSVRIFEKDICTIIIMQEEYFLFDFEMHSYLITRVCIKEGSATALPYSKLLKKSE